MVADFVSWASEAAPGSRAEPRITNLVNSSGLPIILRRLLGRGRGPQKLGSIRVPLKGYYKGSFKGVY